MMKRIVTRLFVAAAAVAALLAGAGAARAACSATAGDFDGNGSIDLRLRGDAGPQFLSLTDTESGVAVRLSCNGDDDVDDPTDIVRTFPGPIETFDIQLGGRDRILIIVFASGSAKNMLFTLGPGGNAVSCTITPTASHFSVTFDIQGGPGADSVTLLNNAVSSSALVVRGDLGAGDDRLVLSTGDLADATQLVGVDLGPGRNEARLTWSRAAHSFVSASIDGGDVATGTDIVTLGGLLQLQRAARVFLELALRGGNDVFDYESSLEMDGASEAHVRVEGGPGNDALAAALVPTRYDGLYDLQLAGGGGNDVLTLDGSGVDGAAGTDRLRLDGGDGNDTVIASFEAPPASTKILDLLESGGRGVDTVYQGLLVPSGLRYGVGGAALLDGGRDAPDTCLTFGNGSGAAIDCEPLF
jgi:hypothetical protein